MSLSMWSALVVGAPLATFLAFLLGMGRSPKGTVVVSLITATLACVGTWMLALNMPTEGFQATVEWAATDDFAIYLGVRLTGLTTAMGIVVGTVHLLVQIYSVGYMALDPAKARYFAFLSLFASAMLSVVYAADLAHTFSDARLKNDLLRADSSEELRRVLSSHHLLLPNAIV